MKGSVQLYPVAAALGRKVSDAKARKIKPLGMRDQKDRSPLRHAMKNDHVRVAAYLLDSGARVEADLLDWMKDDISVICDKTLN